MCHLKIDWFTSLVLSNWFAISVHTVCYICTHGLLYLYTRFVISVHTVCYICIHGLLYLYTRFAISVHTVCRGDSFLPSNFFSIVTKRLKLTAID